jgi:hypothetical protein
MKTMPRRFAVVLILLAASGSACKEKTSEAPGDKPAMPTKVAEPPAAKPVLTPALLKEAEALVSVGEAWDVAYPKFKAKLGEPSVVDNESYIWAVATDTTCSFFYSNPKDGKVFVGKFAVDEAAKDEQAFADCVRSSKGQKSE